MAFFFALASLILDPSIEKDDVYSGPVLPSEAVQAVVKFLKFPQRLSRAGQWFEPLRVAVDRSRLAQGVE